MKRIPAAGIVGEAMREAAASEFSAIIDLVRRALLARIYPGQPDRYISIDGIYADRIIVARDGRSYSYAYTIDENNRVVLGDPTEVIKTHQPVTMREAAIPDGDSITDSFFIEAKGEAEAGKWLIRIIRSGLSSNNNFYPDAVLREAAPLFNGARVFVKSDAEHIKGEGKSFKQLIGGLSETKFIEGAKPDTGELHAVFTLIEPEGETAVKLREAKSRKLDGLFGFSVDMSGSSKKVMREGKRVSQATSIKKVDSVDLIVEPGAGGQLIRMVESINPEKEQDTMRTRMLEAIHKKDPTKFAGQKPEDIDDETLEIAYREAFVPTAAAVVADDNVKEQIRMIEARSNMRTTIAESKLPQPAKDRLVADFNKRERFVEADVTAAITVEREYLARFTESGKPVIDFGEGGRSEDRSVKIAGMLDAFFDPAHKDHRSVGSFKECYIEVTGDKKVTGRLRDCDLSRMRESVGASFRESLDSSSFGDVLGDSIARRMQALYTGNTELQSWRKVAVVGRTSDFRTQEVGRIGGYGNLPDVGQGDPYAPLTSPGDDKATWGVTKRGGTEDVTLEMIKNDDVRLIMRIPQELQLAAANTLYEFAFDFFRTNPNAWDGTALYHADHGNLFTVALSAAEYKAHRLAMQKMTRSGSLKRLATSPGFLLVPFDLQDTAFDLFVRGTNNDKTFVQTLNPEIITVDYWQDATDWVTVAPKEKLPVLEIDFLDGQEEPELFVQDNPTTGSMFTNDKLTYKIRHIYGGNLLVDAEKGTTKAVVA